MIWSGDKPMGYEFSALFDLGALVIVLCGTLLATLARCGWSDLKIALHAALRMGSQEFDVAENRMALAPSVSEINRRGLLCTDIPMPPDKSLAKVVIAYVRSGSVEMLDAARQSEQSKRETKTARAVQTFDYAGELAPVFGLVGTLFAITQLTPMAGEGVVDLTMASIATAVLSSLYGVLFAHLICIPIARAIHRKAAREEVAREEIIEWLSISLSGGIRKANRQGASSCGECSRKTAA
ncbi:MotA/TolQ/ExbB proton channel family protein [Erythrobacter sp. YT30]|uniref:MotA/TolQ/ExbB proton channel family protein n=1 Tax=Erythrobacter sp. YT30 TaxID=1735012 RepID=UPI00076D4551|nr:MotA/TolQ/ExbB proton channel family protein [Erythrobacter sp. YT30]KWV91664.1 hypothetical protein AUC45_10655 [Erythrobacter sp. YT30]